MLSIFVDARAIPLSMIQRHRRNGRATSDGRCGANCGEHPLDKIRRFVINPSFPVLHSDIVVVDVVRSLCICMKELFFLIIRVRRPLFPRRRDLTDDGEGLYIDFPRVIARFRDPGYIPATCEDDDDKIAEGIHYIARSLPPARRPSSESCFSRERGGLIAREPSIYERAIDSRVYI